jgi:osmotically-inducible protein OsmY
VIETTRFRVVSLVIAMVQLLFGCSLERPATSGAGREDATLTADVKAVIAQHPDLGPPNLIYVDTRDRVVYLSGSVNTELTRTDAEALARQAPGVTRVVTTIAVDE